MPELIPINCLRRGETAEVCEVFGDETEVRRLQEMGFCEGNKLEIVQQGCPLIVRLRGGKYCLRGNECTCVMVKRD